jgi:hypothetical protein
MRDLDAGQTGEGVARRAPGPTPSGPGSVPGPRLVGSRKELGELP